jgi:hypothetical protein
MWRLLRVSKDGLPQTLFHGWLGSRTLPIGVWLDAETKYVTNPGGDKRFQYVSGWHVLPTKAEAEAYKTRFKDQDNLVVCEVEAMCLRDKERSRANVKLAYLMLIREEFWKEALNALPKGL